VSAEGFLHAHREWLRTHSFLSPILEAYDSNLLMPTPTLQAIQSALVDHMLLQQIRKQEAKMAAAEEGEEAVSAPYTITLFVKAVSRSGEESVQEGTITEVVGYRILTEEGDVWVKTRDQAEGHHIMERKVKVSPAQWNAHSFGEAMNLADRQLFRREDSVHAVIVNTQGIPIRTEVSRGDALARVLRSPKRAAEKGTGKTSSSLKWVGRARQDRASFSHG
jgi:hypothetical protein